jgi:uncharacterized repeat protein (TIGR03803 family)
VVYELDASGRETVLHSFTGGDDGEMPCGYGPSAGVTLDSKGDLYGTTSAGGTYGYGVVYMLNPAGQETVYSFVGYDGQNPCGGVVLDPAGNLYGTTYRAGTGDSGVVYKLEVSLGGETASLGGETVLYSFTGGADGGYPEAGVILDAAGDLFGTTPMGGTNAGGVVFKLTPQ